MYINKILVSLSSSLFFIGMFYWLSNNTKGEKYFAGSRLTQVGKYTLGIYILQSILLETIMAEYIKVDRWGGIFALQTFYIYIVFPILSFIMIIVYSYLTKQISRNSFLSFWLLGTIKKK